MRATITAFSLSTVLILCSSAALAQNSLSNYTGNGNPSANQIKHSVDKSIETLVEMSLVYKMMEQPNLVSVDNGIIVAYGNTLRKYDKDLNFVKEVDLDVNVDSVENLASKFAKKYSNEIMDTWGGLTPGFQSPGFQATNYMQAKIRANEAMAKATLRAISTAAESYATANNGTYPTNMTLLTQANPPYLNEDYCAASPISGYKYNCSEMNTYGYSITATPQFYGQTGTRKYTIKTGGILTP